MCRRCGELAPPYSVICPHDGAVVVPADQDPMRGEMVGNYRVLKRLGVGGMGAVYAAVDVTIDKQVAIKLVHPHVSNNPNLSSLLAEAKAINAIADRGIVDIYGFGELPDGRHYLVMEQLSGESLESVLKREHRLSAKAIVELAEPILSSLEAAHAAGFVHRDIKPANVFIVKPSRGPAYTKLLDFGLAQRARAGTGIAAGTPAYAAPEQALSSDVGPAADLYAVGCLLFECATGHLPFRGDARTIVDAHAYAPRPHPRQEFDDVPEALDALIVSLMQIDAKARPPSATAVKAALAAVLPPAAAPHSSGRTAWLGAALSLALIGVGLGVWVTTHRQPPREATTVAPPPVDDPVRQQVTQTASHIAGQLDGAHYAEAVDALLAAEQSFPQQREWEALHASAKAHLTVAVKQALERAEHANAEKLSIALSRLGPLDEALSSQLKRVDFAQKNGMALAGDVAIDRYEYPNRDGVMPLSRVEWKEATSLCRRSGKHLCSEDEWQRACIALTSSCPPLSAQPKAIRKTGSGHCPAGSAHELLGNLAEWTFSAWAEGRPQRVIRGGSFAQSPSQASCTARDYYLPGLGGSRHIGFRCCY